MATKLQGFNRADKIFLWMHALRKIIFVYISKNTFSLKFYFII